MREVLDEVLDERIRQDSRWGQQNHPFIHDNKTKMLWQTTTNQVSAKRWVDEYAKYDALDFAGIITEEYHEALEAETVADQREELIQLAACCVAAVESLDRNGR